MKKAFLILTGVALIFSACKEEKNAEEKSSNPDTVNEEKMLEQAFRRKDYATAIVSINTIMAKDTSRTDLYDTLFVLYSELQNPYGAIDVGKELIKKKPNDRLVLETLSQAYELTGDLPAAANLYNKLFTMNADPRLKLALANNYFNQGKVPDAEKELQWVVNNRAVSDTIIMEQPLAQNNEKMQKIKLTAVAYFLMGQLYAQTGQKQKAINSLNQALKIEPNYDIAASLLLEIQYGQRMR